MQELFAGLFDFSFKKLVTPKLTKMIYIMAIAVSAIAALSTIAASPSVFTFLSAIVIFVVSIVCARISIEVSLAIFQIARYTGELARRAREEQENERPEFGDSM